MSDSRSPAVVILAAKTWGRVGNFAAAQNIARQLDGSHCRRCVVAPIEDFCDSLAQFGERMRDASSACDAAETARRFERVMQDIDTWTASLQAASANAEIATTLHGIADFLRAHEADCVIATKGLIANLVHTCRARHALDIRLVNWITNIGLTASPCHVAKGADVHVVTTRADARNLASSWGVDRSRIIVSGPVLRLTSASSGSTVVAAVAARRPHALAYFHVLTEAVLGQLEELFGCCDLSADLVWSYAEPQLLERLTALASAYPAQITLHSELGQREFHALVCKTTANPVAFLIAKSGPNTMLESVALNLPLLVYRSGLPQEDWVIEYIANAGIGVGISDVCRLAAAVRLLARDGPILERIKARQREHWAMLLAQGDGTTVDVMRRILGTT